jgi:hypothetical protein
MAKKVAYRSNSVPTVSLTQVFLYYHLYYVNFLLIYSSSLILPTCDGLWWPISHVEADLVGHFVETAEEGGQKSQVRDATRGSAS